MVLMDFLNILLLLIDLPMTSSLVTDRIFGTPLTWEILQGDLQKARNSTAFLGPRTIAHHIGEGAGFISKNALIDFEWLSNDPNDLGKMPNRAVIKIIQKNPNSANSTDVLQESLLNDTELQFYTGNKTDLGIPEDLKIPKFYCGRPYGQDDIEMGYIAIEYSNGEMLQMYEEIPENGIFEVLDQLIEMANTSLRNPDSLKNWDDSAMASLLRAGRKVDKISNLLEKMRALYPKLSPEVDEMLKKVPLIFGDFDRFMDLRKSTSDRSVLCHGDLWTPNILWNRGQNGSLDLAVILDWQLVNSGSPTEDLVYFLHSAMSADTYPNKFKEYLTYYYSNLKKALGKLPMPWTNYDEFLKNYEISYAYVMIVLMPWYTIAKEELLGKFITNPQMVSAFDDKITFSAHETVRCLNKWF